jgi:hypothetical protein
MMPWEVLVVFAGLVAGLWVLAVVRDGGVRRPRRRPSAGGKE